MRAIAKAAGVSHVAVSLALRKHSSIPLATRQRIEAIAKSMGYRPDPALSALGAYRLSLHRSQYQSTLAWIDANPGPKPLHENPGMEHYFCWVGAQKRAEALGYQIEVFRLHDIGVSMARLNRILLSRNIQGIILSPLPADFISIDLAWDMFSSVALGYSHSSQFHILCSAQYRNARLAVRSLYERGYRRIGFVTWEDIEHRTDMNFSAGAGASVFEAGQTMPIFRLPDRSGSPASDVLLKRWLKQNKPDALIVPEIRFVFPILQRIGCRVPQDVAVATLAHVPGLSQFAGINQRYERIGEAAVSQLSGLIHQNQRGFSPVPFHLLFDGF